MFSKLFSKNTVNGLSVNEWQKAIKEDKKAVIVDVRSPMECRSGVIKGAVQLNIMDRSGFTKGIDRFDSAKNYYVYCRSGNRSKQACRLMERKGLKTYNLNRGLSGWSGKLVHP